MSRIKKTFAELKKRGEAALIPFITAGDPDLDTTLKIMRALEAGGADCIELGIPFSDPTADGPTIQRSSERALKRPVSLPAVFRLVRKFRQSSQVPVVLFGYFNPLFRFGLERFACQAAASGADGVLCVDLPPEESGELKRWTDAVGLDLIFLLSPTSGADRIELVGRARPRFRLLCFGDRRDRRAPFLRRYLACASRPGAPSDCSSGGRRLRHLDAAAGGLDRRFCRRGGGRQRPGGEDRKNQGE